MATAIQEEEVQAVEAPQTDSIPSAEPLPKVKAKQDKKSMHQFLVVLCYVVAAGCLGFVFRKMDFGTLRHQMSVLQPGWLLAAMLGSMVVYLANAVRWTILTTPLLAENGKKVSFWKTLHAVYIGLFFNEVLPLRPGEVIRCYLFSRWNGLALSATFASAVLERILDGVWLLGGFFIITMLVHLPRALMTGAKVAIWCIGVGLAAWLILAYRAAQNRKRAGWVRRTGVKADIFEALELTGKPRQLLFAGLASAMPITFNVIAMWFLMKGAGMNLPLVAAMAVLLIIRVATIIPNTPGNIGSYQFVCVLSLGLFHVGASEAAVFSLLSFTIFTLPLLVGGAIAVAASGQKMGALLHVGDAAEASAA